MQTVSTNINLDTAHKIARYLCKSAIRTLDGRCNWVGASMEFYEGQNKVIQRSLENDFYEGLSGIALFLAEISRHVQDPVIDVTLDSTVRTIISNQKSGSNPTIGFYSGTAGIAYSLWKIGLLKNNPDLCQTGISMIKALSECEFVDYSLDVIAGPAGTIPVILKMYDRDKDEELLDLALKFGRHLIEKAKKNDNKYSWETIPGNRGLTGYSHGNAGIALSLLELYRYTSDEIFKSSAQKAFNYEKSHFQPMMNNWPDLREGLPSGTNGQAICGDMWCHGAAGIGLSRIRAYQLTNNPELLKDAEIALSTTYVGIRNILNSGNLTNFSLCHGIAGNADILLSAGMLLNKPEFISISAEVAQRGIREYADKGLDWPSGINDPSGVTPGGQETQGLLLGLSGTGLYYLRQAVPTVESVLLII